MTPTDDDAHDPGWTEIALTGNRQQQDTPAPNVQ
jgi:hypothetical protein